VATERATLAQGFGNAAAGNSAKERSHGHQAMSATTQLGEEALCASFERQAACYQRAFVLAEELCAACRSGQSKTELVEQISGILGEAGLIQAELQGAMRQWQERGCSPGPHLQSVLAQVAGAIQRLDERIHEIERFFQTRKSLLAPEFDTLVRARQMQRAYRIY